MLNELWSGSAASQYWNDEHLLWLLTSIIEAKWLPGFNALMKAGGDSYSTTSAIFQSLSSEDQYNLFNSLYKLTFSTDIKKALEEAISKKPFAMSAIHFALVSEGHTLEVKGFIEKSMSETTLNQFAAYISYNDQNGYEGTLKSKLESFAHLGEPQKAVATKLTDLLSGYH